jgi:P27 family predicted phage terminase small subunit
LKLLRGNPGQRKIVPTVEAPPGDAPPDPPTVLSGFAVEEWRRVAPELHRLKLLTGLDVSLLACYCEAYRRWRVATELIVDMGRRDAATGGLLVKAANGNAAINPLTWVAASAARTMLQTAAELGMSPVARSRISAGLPPGPQKFKGLIAG